MGQGVGKIRFGQTERQTIEQLGLPDKTYQLEAATRLQYFDLQLELAFENERENRLGWIEIKHPDATLFQRKLMGENAETVLPVVADNIFDEPEHEDYGSLETYFYENYRLELQFEMNRLRSINIGVLWLDNDTPQ